jgi:sulfide dehydrogenase cytochrome subunit
MVSACLACHVLTGNSGDAPPALAMPESRFTAAMRAFRSGQRQGSVMNRIAAGYTEEDIQELARFLASREAHTR